MRRPDFIPAPRLVDHLRHWLYAALVLAALYLALRYGPAQ